MLDALLDATLSIYPGLGPALEIHWFVIPSSWFHGLAMFRNGTVTQTINFHEFSQTESLSSVTHKVKVKFNLTRCHDTRLLLLKK